jgi:hypothetical protein
MVGKAECFDPCRHGTANIGVLVAHGVIATEGMGMIILFHEMPLPSCFFFDYNTAPEEKSTVVDGFW